MSELIVISWYLYFKCFVISSNVTRGITIIARARILCWWSCQANGQEESSCQSKLLNTILILLLYVNKHYWQKTLANPTKAGNEYGGCNKIICILWLFRYIPRESLLWILTNPLISMMYVKWLFYCLYKFDLNSFIFFQLVCHFHHFLCLEFSLFDLGDSKLAGCFEKWQLYIT